LISWSEILFDYDFAVIHRPGIKNNLPDHLSRFFTSSEGGEALPTIRTLTVSNKPTTETVALILPDEHLRPGIIERNHLRGHFGITATVTAIHQDGFNWPNLRSDVANALKQYLLCLQFNNHRTIQEATKSITATKPFDYIAIDLASPFPVSEANNTFMFILIDIHTRFVIL
ncbi:hypothetical protein BJ085DRAFT_21307, partial [Dimargaris cristalligena]